MPDPFFDDIAKAYQAVVSHPGQKITVTRGDKSALVMMSPEDSNAIYVRITHVTTERAENAMRVNMTKKEEVS